VREGREGGRERGRMSDREGRAKNSDGEKQEKSLEKVREVRKK
jgi:hypothetical protein